MAHLVITFTATTGNTTVDVTSWNIANLTISDLPANTTFVDLTVTATEQDSDSPPQISAATSATELVTVTSLGTIIYWSNLETG